jgi:hypothetical protein
MLGTLFAVGSLIAAIFELRGSGTDAGSDHDPGSLDAVAPGPLRAAAG